MELIIEEEHRKDRLESVQRLIETFDPTLAAKIKSINDHKGCLEVSWSNLPTTADRIFLEKSWDFHGEYNIEHYDAEYRRL